MNGCRRFRRFCLPNVFTVDCGITCTVQLSENITEVSGEVDAVWSLVPDKHTHKRAHTPSTHTRKPFSRWVKQGTNCQNEVGQVFDRTTNWQAEYTPLPFLSFSTLSSSRRPARPHLTSICSSPWVVCSHLTITKHTGLTSAEEDSWMKEAADSRNCQHKAREP